jgi:hypothetical protein
MPFFSLMLGDIIVLVFLLAASPLIVTLSFGLRILQFYMALFHCLGSVVSQVLRCLPPIMSLLSSTFSNLAQGVSRDFTFAEYTAAWRSFQPGHC